MSDDVKSWLKKLSLGKYAEVFAENEIDFRSLPRLSEDDLKELGLPLGARRSLQAAIELLPKDLTGPVPVHQTEPIATSGEAERRQLTVMFCDLAGSTELSQKLDPEDLRDLNRTYQDVCKAGIERYGGYVARYMGDGVLAYFGYPEAHEDDAERAIHAGLGIVDSIVNVRQELRNTHDITLGVRIGIATGPVVVGDLIGEGASQESAVVGETPNLAARLQTIASINSVVIGLGTRDLASGRFKYEDLGPYKIKGFGESIRVWRVVAPSEVESRFEAQRGSNVTPLLGRVHEIGMLLERWTDAKEGDGQAVLLVGEPGIGKSRISESLRERTASDYPIRLRYQCSSYHTNSALHPFIEQLQRAAQFEPEESNSTRLDKLEALLLMAKTQDDLTAPLVASLMSIPFCGRFQPLNMTREQQKEATMESLVSQMVGLSRQQPILMIFEDAHWADPTSVELLGHIIDRLPEMAALVVITFRHELSSPWMERPHVTTISLSRFNRSLATSMIEKVTGGKLLPEEIRNQIINKTDGVPLFIEELTKTVIESDLLETKGDQYTLTRPLTELAIPSTLHDSLMARLDRLAPVREVAQMAAVIGREFPHQLLAAVSPLTEQELDAAMTQLMDAALVFRKGFPPNANYTFKHALVQNAAYESLLKRKRRELHERIAEALESELGGPVEAEPELLAHHFTESGNHERALPYWLLAGQNAVAHGAKIEAVAHLRRGLELLATLPETEKLIKLEISFRVALGVPLLSLEGPASTDVADNYTRAQALCEAIGDTEQQFPVLWGLWFLAMNSSNISRACDLADKLLGVARERDDESLLLEAHHCQWPSRLLIGDISSAVNHSDYGRKLYRAGAHHSLTFIYGGHDPGVCAHNFKSLAVYLTGYPDLAKKVAYEGLQLAQKLGHSGSIAEALCFVLYVSLFNEDIHALEQHAETLEEYSQSEQISLYQIIVDVARGYSLINQNQVDRGLEQFREVMELANLRNLWEEPLLTSIACTVGDYGEFEQGLELTTKALNLAQQRDIRWWEAELLRTQGELMFANGSGDAEGAKDCFKQAIKVAQDQQAKTLELRASTSLTNLWYEQKNKEAAHDLLEPIYEWFTEGFDTPDLKRAKTLLEKMAS
jgi:class 3 adenylate cyclase/predicted ATPase